MNEYDIKYFIRPVFERTPITEELLKMPPADGSTIPKEFLKMGPNQLSVNENLISRKQAIEKVKAYKIFAPTDGVEKTLNAVIEAIAHSIAGLPAADVEEVRHGRWVIDEWDTPNCSVCGCSGIDDYYATPYCPHCGASMDEKSKCVECKGGYCEEECEV